MNKCCSVSDKPVVLMADEVDSAANHQVFLDFLAQLRASYIDRDEQPTFQSVILAGVYDIKNLKYKLHPEDGHKMNGSRNIAADFDVDMSFSAAEISGAFREYLDAMLQELLFTGNNIVYNSDEPAIDIATMFGFIRNQGGTVAIANRIFETRLYNHYLSAAGMQREDIYKASLREKNRVYG